MVSDTLLLEVPTSSTICRQDRMQRVVVCHVEHRDVRVLAGDAPQVQPGALALQVLGARLLLGLQPIELRRVDPVWRVHIHPDVVEQDVLPMRARNDAACLDRA